MVTIDTEALLQEITPQAPCGEDLQYDPLFLAIERGVQGSARDRLVGPVNGQNSGVQGPDWRAIAADAAALLNRTKDVRVLIMLSKASLHAEGLAGFSRAIASLRALLERYWDSLHPQLVVEGEDNTLMRINALRELCDRESVLLPLRSTPLVSVSGIGSFGWREIAGAPGQSAGAPRTGSTAPDAASINAAFANCDLADLAAIAAAARRTFDDLECIQKLVAEKVAARFAFSLEDLVSLIGRIQTDLAARLSLRGGPAAAPTHDQNAVALATPENAMTSTTLLSAPLAITSRRDVVRVLDALCEYYDRNEPSSPVPLLLKRAKRLVSMSFLDIVRDLAPAGMSEIEKIRGPQEADNGTSRP